MPAYQTGDIHNILLAGFGGSGKTTLTEAMLFAAGSTSKKGSVATGDTVCDFEKEEKEHGQSMYPAVVHFDYQGARINLIDAPGAAALIGQAITCLPAVETLLLSISAESGVDPVARRLVKLAADLKLPVAIVVNRIDGAGVDLKALIASIQDTFGAQCLPVNLPADGSKTIVDCLLSSSGDSDLGPVGAAHGRILDQIVEMDDALMEKYLGGEEPDHASLHGAFIRAMNENHLVPICFTNAKDDVGIKELLDVIVKHLPTPLEGNKRSFVKGEGADAEPVAYEVDSAKPLLGHVFKVYTDPYVGKIALFRVFQGCAAVAGQVLVGGNRKGVKLGHVFHPKGKEQKEVDAIIAGDIGAVAKIEEIHAGDLLHDEHTSGEVHHPPLAFPAPLFGLAIHPKARGDEGKISTALSRITEEDPTFKVHADPETHELVIYGLGDLHLRLILERLKNRGLEVNTQPPKIAYRETITAKAEGHHRHKKQTGGAGQFGEVFLRVEPKERGGGFEFLDDVFGGSIPAQLVAAVEKGVRDILEQGAIAGFPVQDVKVIVYDGKTHPVDSKEIAFRTAGKYAFKDAIAKAKPVVLEPIVSVEVTAPVDKVGAITGDLAGKRGRILGTDTLGGGIALIRAVAPLAEMMQYQAQLTSVTAGQGSFSMELSHYDPVPAQVQQRLMNEFKPKAEE